MISSYHMNKTIYYSMIVIIYMISSYHMNKTILLQYDSTLNFGFAVRIRGNTTLSIISTFVSNKFRTFVVIFICGFKNNIMCSAASADGTYVDLTLMFIIPRMRFSESLSSEAVGSTSSPFE